MNEVACRLCNECGEAWEDTGTEVCPFCGSLDTSWLDDEDDA